MLVLNKSYLEKYQWQGGPAMASFVKQNNDYCRVSTSYDFTHFARSTVLKSLWNIRECDKILFPNKKWSELKFKKRTVTKVKTKFAKSSVGIPSELSRKTNKVCCIRIFLRNSVSYSSFYLYKRRCSLSDIYKKILESIIIWKQVWWR